MVLMTGGALVLGAVIVVFAALQGGGPLTSGSDVLAPDSHVPTLLAEGRTLGKADAPVTVDIWSDFQCPACRQFVGRTEPAIISNYVVPGTAKFVYHDAAFIGQRTGSAYDESVEAGAAARCAADQDKFWDMHGWIFANWNGENRGAFLAPRLRQIASSAGLEMNGYDSCVASGDHQAAVRAETNEAVALGVSSTPTIFVNGVAFAGALTAAQLSDLIDRAAP
jgi:protein-disulfide isomerase